MWYLIEALEQNGYSAVRSADDDSLCHVFEIETGNFVSDDNGEPLIFDKQALADFLKFVSAN